MATYTNNINSNTLSYTPGSGQLNHIFKNNFYDVPPLPVWSFSIDIVPNSDGLIYGENSVSMCETIAKAITKINIPERSVSSVRTNFLGISQIIPTRAQNSYDNITLEFAENENMVISNLLEDLFSTVYNTRYPESENISYRSTDSFYQFDLIIKIYKQNHCHTFDDVEHNKPVFIYKCNRCCILNISSLDLNYNDDDSVINRSMTVCCQWLVKE